MVHGTVTRAARRRNEQLQQEVSTDNPLRKYKVMKKIGRGATSDVYRGETMSGETVAIKMMPVKLDPDDGLIFPRFINEIVIHRDHSHPNMVKYLDSYMMGKYVWIVMEHVDGVSLAGKNAYLYSISSLLYCCSGRHGQVKGAYSYNIFCNFVFNVKGPVLLICFYPLCHCTFEGYT